MTNVMFTNLYNLLFVSQEVALINGSHRTATIVSKAFVELLAIDKEVLNFIAYYL